MNNLASGILLSAFLTLAVLFLFQRDMVKVGSDAVTDLALASHVKSQNDGTLKSDDLNVNAVRANLVRLQKQWLEIWRPDNEMTEKGHALAEESVRFLLCGEEMVSLMDFLKKNHFGDAVIKLYFEQAWKSLFKSDLAALARQSLVDSRANNYRPDWSYYAGSGCSAENVEMFCKALQDSTCQQNAKCGYFATLAERHPKEAVSGIYQEILKDPSGPRVWGSLESAIASISTDARYDEILSTLNNTPSDDNEFNVEFGEMLQNPKKILFKKWANQNPAEVTNFIFSHQDQYGPETLAWVADAYSERNLKDAVAWLQDLPSGRYFDHAALSVSSRSLPHYPKQTIELVEMISDPNMKKIGLDMIKAEKLRAGKLHRSN